jgi:WD40 repeat protein
VTGDAASSFNRLATGELADTARIVELGELDAVVHESSGVAVSRAYSEVLWTHNDGSDGRLFAMRPDGTVIATVAVDGPDVQDWEDLALGPCPPDGPQDRDCLYVGDIGDNEVQRTVYGVDIIPEPDPFSDRRVRVLRRVQFAYPDGAADAEALALAPDGVLRLITKGSDGTARLYRLPVDADTSPDAAPRRSELVGTLPLDVAATRDRVTGAAVSRDGTRLALRSHRAVYLFPLAEPLDAPAVCEIGMLQPQGEAIDYIQADMLILTSEAAGGRSPVLRLRCP